MVNSITFRATSDCGVERRGVASRLINIALQHFCVELQLIRYLIVLTIDQIGGFGLSRLLHVDKASTRSPSPIQCMPVPGLMEIWLKFVVK